MSASYYDTLGVTPSATPAVIRAAYRARIRETHPDSGGDPAEAGAVNHAFSVLSDEHARTQYDRALTKPAPAAAPATASTKPSTDNPRPEPVDRPRRHPRKLFSFGWAAWLTPVPLYAATVTWGAIGAAARTPVGLEIEGSALGAFVVGSTLVAGILLAFRRWLLLVIAIGGTVAFAGSQGIGGYVTYQLLFALLSGAGILALQHRRAVAASLATVERFWAAASHPGTTGWFITAAESRGATTAVALSDVVTETDSPTLISATLWGRYPAGVYVAVDLQQNPAQVHAVAVARDFTRVTKANRRRMRAQRGAPGTSTVDA